MPVVSLDNITVNFGSSPILDGITLSIEAGERIGLVGPNGEGKTTLLSVITGALEPDSGNVYRQRGLRIGILPQNHRLSGGLSLFDAVYAGHPEIHELEIGMQAISRDGIGEKDLEKYQQMETRFAQLDGYSYKNRVEGVLNGLGFSEDQFGISVNSLSGGERNRAAIAGLLLADPDLLLLDEPTNHIDYSGLQWLADYLENCGKGYIVVSHDRYFLDRIAKSIVEVRDGNVTRFAGNYTFYERERRRIDKELLKRFEAQRAQIARTEEFIRRNIAGQKTKQAQGRRKLLARVERIAPPKNADEIRLRFRKVARGGNDVLRIKGLSAGFGERTLFEDFDLFIGRGERIGIVGPNGCGKTTLLSIMGGLQKPIGGSVKLGSNVEVGFYSQDFSNIDESHSAFREIHDFDPAMSEEAVRGALALFSLRGDDIFRPLSTFSGGEIARVALLKLLLGEANLLLLDEPTNHLDIPSRITLERALSRFEGTVIVVSHDRYFLRNVAKRIVAFEADGIKIFDGGFDDYLERRDLLARAAEKSQKSDVVPSKNEPKKGGKRSIGKNLFKLQRDRKEIEKQIATTEAEIKRVGELLSDEQVARDWARMSAFLSEYEGLSRKLERMLRRWEKIEQELLETPD